MSSELILDIYGLQNLRTGPYLIYETYIYIYIFFFFKFYIMSHKLYIPVPEEVSST